MIQKTSDPLYLALDQGGHSSRAIVVDAQGRIVAKVQEPVSTQRLDADRVEQDASELTESLKRCCIKIAEELGRDASRIESAGLATQRSSIVCWERDTGLPLSPVLSWQDRRAWQFVESLEPFAEKIKQITGLVLTPHYGASKMRWCLQELTAVKAAAKNHNLVVGPLASFLTRQLTSSDKNFCDPANASRTQLWDAEKCDWSKDLCGLFEVKKELLPKAVPTKFPYGIIQLGDHSAPLSVVTGDQSAVVYAFGEPRNDTIYINMGTGAFIQWPVGRKIQKITGLLNSVVYQDENGADYVLEGTVNGAGSALSWLAKQTGSDPKTLVSEGVKQANLGTESPPIFINGISGLGSPFWVADMESRFIGESSEPLKAFAVLESIAFLIYENLQRMKTLGKPIEKIVLTGGLASVDYLCQSIANICDASVERSDIREATSRGVIHLLAQQQKPKVTSVVFDCLQDQELRRRYSIWKTEMGTLTGAAVNSAE